MKHLGVIVAASLLLSGSAVQAFIALPSARTVVVSGSKKTLPTNSLLPLHHQKRVQRQRGSSYVYSASSLTRQNLFGVGAGATLALPGWEASSLACVLPTCLGFYKREYGVSYAYGAATSVLGYLICRGLPATASSLALWHAGALVFYGVRLNLFLLYRQLFVQRIKDMQKKIEERATENEREGDLVGRITGRAPFILSCSLLYYGLCAPLFVTAQLLAGGSAAPPVAPWAIKTLTGLVSLTWFGFILAALGDTTKTIVKANKGEKHLVTGGIFRFFRHPNYTGEVIGWTANCMAGVLAASLMDGGLLVKLAGYILASFFSTAGINFVLGSATNNLEKRQKDEYGEQEDYKDWVKRSWVGFQVKPKPQEEEEHQDPQLELSTDEVEESGSGI